MSVIFKLRRSVAGIFLLFFVAYYINATLFEHTHIVNGVTIVHSHFHASSHHNSQSGGHTANNVTLIAYLTSFQTTGAGIVNYSFVQSECCILLNFEENFLATYGSDGFNYSLRAPPAGFFC